VPDGRGFVPSTELSGNSTPVAVSDVGIYEFLCCVIKLSTFSLSSLIAANAREHNLT
jgi:hypothetical protein